MVRKSWYCILPNGPFSGKEKMEILRHMLIMHDSLLPVQAMVFICNSEESKIHNSYFQPASR